METKRAQGEWNARVHLCRSRLEAEDIGDHLPLVILDGDEERLVEGILAVLEGDKT